MGEGGFDAAGFLSLLEDKEGHGATAVDIACALKRAIDEVGSLKGVVTSRPDLAEQMYVVTGLLMRRKLVLRGLPVSESDLKLEPADTTLAQGEGEGRGDYWLRLHQIVGQIIGEGSVVEAYRDNMQAFDEWYGVTNGFVCRYESEQNAYKGRGRGGGT